MKKTDQKYFTYLKILKEELIPAMGCTEPIALAYCAAKAREVLGVIPDKIVAQVSGSIIKNVKSVIVPNTNHLKGIPAAISSGIIAGDASKELEVIAHVSEQQIEEMKNYLDKTPIKLEYLDDGHVFDIIITIYKDDHYAKVRISDFHTNIVLIEKDHKILYQIPFKPNNEGSLTDHSSLNIKDILDFANTVEIDDVKKTIKRQIDYNMAIANEGLNGNYKDNIGGILLKTCGDNIVVKAKAYASAASYARMNGCELPVIINSGSGNQGITTSIPVIVYADYLKVTEEKLYRALVLANLLTIHQKTSIGRLSAFCGVVSAGASAGAGVAYLRGADLDGISHTIINAIVTIGGMVCDGAKSSCSTKITCAVEAGILSYDMHLNNQDFMADDGLVAENAEQTILNIGRLASHGMAYTNQEIINIMVGN